MNHRQTAPLPGWAPLHDDRAVGSPTLRRLAWPALMAAGLAAVLAAMAPRDGAPGLGLQTWAALVLAALLAWRLTAARGFGLAELARTAGEWLAVAALVVLLTSPEVLASLEQPPRPAPDQPVQVERHRRPTDRPAREASRRPPADQQGRDGLEALTGAIADAWREAFGPDSPTTRR